MSAPLGVSLERRGWPAARVGMLLAAITAGSAIASVAVGTFADRAGRRRSYALLFLALAVTGVAFGLTTNVVVLAVVALAGVFSPDVTESGPFTSLEQAMLPSGLDPRARTRAFGTYNAIATLGGSAGALAGLAGPAGAGIPFVVAGSIKAVYDIALWLWFRRVPLPDEEAA